MSPAELDRRTGARGRGASRSPSRTSSPAVEQRRKPPLPAEEEAGGLRPAEPKRGGLFGWRRREEQPAGEITDETPAPPRHVRLIERPAGDDDHDARR